MNCANEQPFLEIRQPKVLTTGAVLGINAAGLLLVVPVLMSILVVTVYRLSAGTVLLPVAVLLLATFFLPLGFGNMRIRSLVKSLGPAPSPESSIVQLTVSPRLRSGTRAELEDADDIGYLSITNSMLEFRGDSVLLSLPLRNIEAIRKRNIGPRGLFLYGSRLSLKVKGLPEITHLEFAERCSRVLPESRRISNCIFEQLNAGSSAAS